ncbi:MAG TPA: hypothetical protein VIH95_03285 [Acidimicrobiales bacterium]
MTAGDAPERVGAGYGRAPLAPLLAHGGRRVALVEKTPRAGGKTRTLGRQGYGYGYEMFGAIEVQVPTRPSTRRSGCPSSSTPGSAEARRMGRTRT